MKIRYIREGYVKTIDKMKSAIDKKISAEDIRKSVKELIIPEIRHALYVSLYKNFKETDDRPHEDQICKSYKIKETIGKPLDISFRVPNLRYALVREDMNSDKWNKEIYNTYIADRVLDDAPPGTTMYGKTYCSPIKDIHFSGSECIATVRLVNFNEMGRHSFTVTLFPCEFLTLFDKVEDEIREKFGIPFTIKLVLLREESRYFQSTHAYYSSEGTAETPFPGERITNMNLYFFDATTFKDLEKFINRFSSFKKIYLGRLDLMDIKANSLSDIPDLGVKFNYLAFSAYYPDDEDSIAGYHRNPALPNKVSELGDFKKFLKPQESGNDLRPNILIFPEALSPKDVVSISDGVITAEEYNKYAENAKLVSFNPYNGVNTSKDVYYK